MTQGTPASAAIALITAAAQIKDGDEGSAIALADMTFDLITSTPAAHVAEVITNLASYGSVVLEMVATATETDSHIIHQEIALAIAEQEQSS